MWEWLRMHFPGWVVIRITGQNPTALLNLAVDRGIDVYDGEFLADGAIQVRVYFRHLGALRHLARMSGNTFRIESRFGALFFWRYLKKRKMLPVGLLCFVVALYFVSSFTLFIHVESEEPLHYVTETAIKEAAAQQGITVGTPMKEIDFRKAEHQMLLDLPSLAWVGIERQGTLVDIHVVERVVAQKDEETANLLIAAAKPGIIRDVLVKRGVALVQEGQTVAAGEPLVAPEDGVAKAIVTASVWYQAEGVCALEETVTEPSGELQQSWWLEKGDGAVLLVGEMPKDNWELLYQRQLGVDFLQQADLPCRLVFRSYQPQQQAIKTREKEEAIQEAYGRAVQALAGYKPQKSKLIQEDRLVVEEENGRYRVRVVWECLEDICLFSNG